MKKTKEVFLVFLFFFTSWVSAETAFLEESVSKYPGPIYQDIVINNIIYPIGTDQCEERYALIKPILDLYDQPFSLLDLGAAQGYFSFRIAHDYPHSFCTMVEANNTSCYAHHGDMLYDLCQFNCHLKNIFYLHKKMDLSDLSFLNQKEHFDVVIALLVVHLMHDNLQEQIRIIETLLDLGDNLILEVANDVSVIHSAYVEALSHSLDCQYLGEVNRHKDLTSKSTGKLFWFRRKTFQDTKKREKISMQKEVFSHLGGVYPNDI